MAASGWPSAPYAEGQQPGSWRQNPGWPRWRTWPRRITDEPRLVSNVTDSAVCIACAATITDFPTLRKDRMTSPVPAHSRQVLRVPLEIPGVESEQLTVENLGGGHYLVLSIPAAARDLALGDVVCARAVDEVLEFSGVVIPGGNRTLRVLAEAPFIDHLRPRLESLGCRVEHPLPELLAVNLAPDAPGEGITEYLAELAEQGLVQIAPGDLNHQ